MTPVQPPSQPDIFEILSRVGSFYETAWSHLLIYITILVAFVGVIIPVAVQIYQRRFFKVEEQSIKNDLVKYVDGLKTDIAKNVEDKFSVEVKKIEKKFSAETANLHKRLSGAEGGLFFIQGREDLVKKHYDSAAFSYIVAAMNLLDADNQNALQRALKTLIENCLPHLSKSDLDNEFHVMTMMDKLLDKLKKNNNSGQYTDFIDGLVKQLNLAKERSADKK